jgi:PhzF family phenazine biosynthesis protein
MKLPLYQVDSFATEVFRGNPAAVCPLDAWLDERTMQAIAMENALSETAFFVREAGSPDRFAIRWFTPKAEIDLCGHATLASAFVLFETLERGRSRVTFSSKGGDLVVSRSASDPRMLEMIFPSRPPTPCDTPPPELARALGKAPKEVLVSRDYVAVYASDDEVRALAPDFTGLAALDRHAVIVTAPGSGDVDFVSRFFAPKLGVPEDPVTGSAHSTLIPFWAKRLGKSELRAAQRSARGGELFCGDRGGSVLIAGRAVKYLEGTIEI